MSTLSMPSKRLTALGPTDPDDGDLGRRQRGLAIAALVPIKKTRTGYRVPSQSGKGIYTVKMDGEPCCTCPDFEKGRDLPCKHIYAVGYAIQREEGADQPITNGHHANGNGHHPEDLDTLPEPSIKDLVAPRPTYPQDWPKYNAGQVNEGEHFLRLLRALCDAVIDSPPVKGNGRPRLPLADVIFCAAVKVYSTFSTRRAMSYIQQAKERGYLDKAPSFPSVFRYMESPDLFAVVHDLVIASARPLRDLETVFSPDSSGFSSSVFDRWFDHKWGHAVSETRWVKLHLMCGVHTHIVTVAEATDRPTNDAPYLPGFLETTGDTFFIESVPADRGYLAKNNYRAIHDAGAKGFIPFKSNSVAAPGPDTHHKRDALWEKAYHFFHLHRDEFDQHYHQRSNVETVFSMIKARFGGAVRSRTPDAQVNEVMLKVLCHNICVLVKALYELDCTFLLDPQPFE